MAWITVAELRRALSARMVGISVIDGYLRLSIPRWAQDQLGWKRGEYVGMMFGTGEDLGLVRVYRTERNHYSTWKLASPGGTEEGSSPQPGCAIKARIAGLIPTPDRVPPQEVESTIINDPQSDPVLQIRLPWDCTGLGQRAKPQSTAEGTPTPTLLEGAELIRSLRSVVGDPRVRVQVDTAPAAKAEDGPQVSESTFRAARRLLEEHDYDVQVDGATVFLNGRKTTRDTVIELANSLQ